MDSSDPDLDRMEAQRSTDVSRGLFYVFLRRLTPRVFYRSREEGTPPSTDVSQELNFGDDSSTPRQKKKRKGRTSCPWGRVMPVFSIITPRSFFRAKREDSRRPVEVAAAEVYSKLRLSDFLNLPDEYVEMDPVMFSEVSNGGNESLEKLKSNGTSVACFKSVQRDSVLHLAARWNHLELARSITCDYPCLVFDLNSKAQLPIHVAAHAGHLAVVKALVATIRLATLSEEDKERLNLYIAKDIDGDTPLHVALKRRDMKIALYMVKKNKQASFLANKQRISPLYMAVEAGHVNLVKAMLRNDEGRDPQLEGRKYLAHAALKSRSTDMLDVVLKKYPSLVKDRDEEGRSCLSYGAFIGFYDGVCYLFDHSTKYVFECNDDGSFPIHTAVEKCRTRISEEILKRCPDSKHLPNKQGQNILHVAAKFGHHRLARSWMLHEETRHLGVGQDVDGNTPLHLATLYWRSNCISTFIWDEDILQLRNNSGLRARDIAELNVKPNYIYEERLTLAPLLYATHHSLREPIKSITKPTDLDTGKDYVNTLLLVAALVATMTFAVGFTMPGGFNSSGPNLGRATLANNPILFVFLLVDTLAMQCSFATIATLIWAQMGDKAIVRSSLNVALPLLLVALLCMPLAFLFGMVTAISHVKWFLTVICVISSIFFYWALFILAPHVLLQLSNVSPDGMGNYLVMLIRCEDCLRYLHHVLYLGVLKWLRRRLCGKSARRLCGNFGK